MNEHRQIVLSNGDVAIVSLCDFHKVNTYRWNPSKDGYAQHTFWANNKVVGRVLMHRFILDPQPGQLVDHIDGNKLNNTRENIRIADRAQNAWNAGPGKRNKSGKRGVHFVKRLNKWCVQIKAREQRVTVGFFAALEDAVRAREEAETKYFGEFTWKAR